MRPYPRALKLCTLEDKRDSHIWFKLCDMRTAYREHLNNFSHDLIILCDLVQSIMDSASKALLEASLDPAEAALTKADELDEIRERCEERAVLLLALENPLAKDLRQVVSSIYIVEDLSRMGRLARHIARSARRRHPDTVVPAEYLGYFEEMARLVRHMTENMREVLVHPDPDIAINMASDDDAIDDINHHLLNILTQREWKGSTREAVETCQITRYYERYADHCVSVSGRIIYLATGLDPDTYLAERKNSEREAALEAQFKDLEKQFRN